MWHNVDIIQSSQTALAIQVIVHQPTYTCIIHTLNGIIHQFQLSGREYDSQNVLRSETGAKSPTRKIRFIVQSFIMQKRNCTLHTTFGHFTANAHPSFQKGPRYCEPHHVYKRAAAENEGTFARPHLYR